MTDRPRLPRQPWEGDLPGIVGSGMAGKADAQYPQGNGPPRPPDLPASWPPKNLSDYIGAEMAKVAAFSGDRWMMERISHLIRNTLAARWIPAASPPWVEPTFRSTPWQSIGSVSVNAGSAGVIASHAVGGAEAARVQFVGHDTQQDQAGGAAWATTTWRIGIAPNLGMTPTGPTVNYPGYTNWYGQIGQVEAPVEVTFVVPPQHTIFFVAVNGGGAAITYKAVMRGWKFDVRNTDPQTAADFLSALGG